MKQITIVFLFFATSLSGQNDFAPLGAVWKYTFHKFVTDFDYNCEYNVCDQYMQRLEVIDTVRIQGKKVSMLQQFEENSTFSDIPEIYLHSHNDSVFFYGNGEFHLLYDFTAKDGDTISISVPTYYNGPGSLSSTPNFFTLDSIYHLDVIVEDVDSVLVSGTMRRRVDYRSVPIPDTDFTLPNVIDGLGSGEAFFGYTGGFVADGCYGFFICYEDQNQAYTPYGCCEFPADFPERKFAPLGAEWLYEGWSPGEPNDEGCDHSCQGNYNLFRVEDEINITGRNIAVIRRYHKTKNSDWELTNDVINFYDYDGGFYAFESNFFSFDPTYRTDVSIGDTISSSSAPNYPKFIGDDDYHYGYPRIGGKQVVEAIDTIVINGQSRLKIKHRNLGDFRIGEVIEGIGPLYDGLLGYDQSIPASGCAPRLICYRDDQITYTTTDCGCNFPEGPTSITKHDIGNLNIYPNPSYETIFIDNQGGVQFHTLSILNIQGQTIISTPFHDNRIDISNLSQGIYFIKFIGSQGELIKKFSKR